MTDERAVTDGDTALVLETAAAVDKKIFPHRNIFLPQFSKKGGEERLKEVSTGLPVTPEKVSDFLGAV